MWTGKRVSSGRDRTFISLEIKYMFGQQNYLWFRSIPRNWDSSNSHYATHQKYVECRMQNAECKLQLPIHKDELKPTVCVM